MLTRFESRIRQRIGETECRESLNKLINEQDNYMKWVGKWLIDPNKLFYSKRLTDYPKHQMWENLRDHFNSIRIHSLKSEYNLKAFNKSHSLFNQTFIEIWDKYQIKIN